MTKRYRESEIEFRRHEDNTDYPESRGLVVYQYGGSLEDCITKARKEFNLGDDWIAMSAELPS